MHSYAGQCGGGEPCKSTLSYYRARGWQAARTVAKKKKTRDLRTAGQAQPVWDLGLGCTDVTHEL